VSAPFVKAAVIGQPVAHSLSPLIHSYWIGKYGLSSSYEAIAVVPEELEARVRELFAQGYAGLNVTLPHKQAVMALCDDLDDATRAIGAVNTLVRRPDNRIFGMNTDAAGFIGGIRDDFPAFDFVAGPALVLGAGGAARAILHALRSEGAKDIRIANRSRERADDLTRAFGARAVAWEDRHDAAQGVHMLVNATSLGMKGQDKLPFDVASLPREALVCDIVYNPQWTDLLRDAKARGNPVSGGLGMLLNQARPAFAAWFGIMPDVTDELRNRLQRALPP
jgi:shikimate dehydrogenase